MAHAGIGSVSHTGCLLLGAAIGIKPTMVPFTGTGPAMNALLAGQVDYVCDPIVGPMPHVRAGTIKALAVAGGGAIRLLPDVPTAAEGGLPQFSAAPFYGVFAPKGTPRDRRPLGGHLARGLTRTWAQAPDRSRRRRAREANGAARRPCRGGEARDRTDHADHCGRQRKIGPLTGAGGAAMSIGKPVFGSCEERTRKFVGTDQRITSRQRPDGPLKGRIHDRTRTLR